VRPRAKVTSDSLLEVVYGKLIGTEMNDLDLCLEVVSRSCQPLHYIRRWISRKPLEIEAWFQGTSNSKWHMDYQMAMWPMTSRDPQKCCEKVRSAIPATAWLLVTLIAITAIHGISLSLIVIKLPFDVTASSLCSSATLLMCDWRDSHYGQHRNHGTRRRRQRTCGWIAKYKLSE